MGIFVVFVFIYLFWVSSIFILLKIGSLLLSKMHHRVKQLESKRAYYVASVLAFVPVLILAMQSVGQLELKDLLLVAIFTIVAIFYIAKRS